MRQQEISSNSTKALLRKLGKGKLIVCEGNLSIHDADKVYILFIICTVYPYHYTQESQESPSKICTNKKIKYVFFSKYLHCRISKSLVVKSTSFCTPSKSRLYIEVHSQSKFINHTIQVRITQGPITQSKSDPNFQVWRLKIISPQPY